MRMVSDMDVGQKPACGRLLPRSRHTGCDPEAKRGANESRSRCAFMGSNRTQKPICLLAEPLVSDRVAVLHKNVLRTSGRGCGEQSSRSTGREARRLDRKSTRLNSIHLGNSYA